MTQGGLTRGNIGAIAQLTLSTVGGDPIQLATLADASRRLGDLETAKRLLGSFTVPDDAAFAAMRSLASILSGTGYVAAAGDTPLPAPFIHRRDVLTPDVLAAVKDLTRNRLEEFVSSGIHDSAYVGVSLETRRSLVLVDPDAFRALILPSLFSIIAGLDLSCVLKIGELDCDRVELQVTAHGDGAFFKPHTDASRSANADRELSFVLYYRLQEHGFSGGDLRLFDASEALEKYASERYTCIEPDDNSLILFPSRCVHEVSPVHVAHQQLQAGRFSLNGWIHRRRC